jgi:ribosomal protein L17
MRHNKHRASLGVTKEHRAAMLSNLAVALIEHGKIQTTLPKAKALRPFIEKVITKAKKAHALPKVTKNGKEVLDARAIHLRRMALKDVRNETAIAKLFNETVTEFVNRPGGYTRIYKLGTLGRNDAAEMAQIEFVKADDPGYKKPKKQPAAAKAEAAPAA